METVESAETGAGTDLNVGPGDFFFTSSSLTTGLTLAISRRLIDVTINELATRRVPTRENVASGDQTPGYRVKQNKRRENYP